MCGNVEPCVCQGISLSGEVANSLRKRRYERIAIGQVGLVPDEYLAWIR